MTEDIHSRIMRAQQGGDRPTVTMVLERMQPDIARSIPKGLDPDRVSRLALTVIRTSELAKAKGISKSSLADCTPESFAGALLTAVALGLEPGTSDCYLVPYQDRRSRAVECQLIIGYQGLAKLFRQHPMAAHIGAQAVYENDTFDYQYGSDAFLRHRPATGDRGDVIAYYADAKLTNGAYEFVVLSPDEVKALRRGKVGPSGDIPDPQRWMEKKTCLRQLLKLLPKQTRVDAAMAVDERFGGQLSREQVPLQIMERPETVQPSDAEEQIDPITGEITESDNRGNDIPANVTPSEPVAEPDTASSEVPKEEVAQRPAATGSGTGSRDRGMQSRLNPEQTSPIPSGEAGTDQGDDPANGPASQSVEDQQAEVRRLSEERRQLRRSQPDQANADPRPGGDDPSGPTEVTTGRDTEPKITVPQQAEINSRFMRLDVTDTQEKVWWANRFAGLPENTVGSVKELTQPEAVKIIAALDRIGSRDELDQLLNGQDELIP